MKLSNIERESNIVFNEAERTASVYTYNPALKAQLSELCRTYPEQVRQTAANSWGGLTCAPLPAQRATPDGIKLFIVSGITCIIPDTIKNESSIL